MGRRRSIFKSSFGLYQPTTPTPSSPPSSHPDSSNCSLNIKLYLRKTMPFMFFYTRATTLRVPFRTNQHYSQRTVLNSLHNSETVVVCWFFLFIHHRWILCFYIFCFHKKKNSKNSSRYCSLPLVGSINY